ncbi:MAG: serine hydrolase domain-containing protein, partial [Desulfosalsimonas sp.]
LDTVFDLASLTKPLATTLAVMDLIEKGKIAMDQPVGEILPEFLRADEARSGSGRAKIRIDHLLAHVSGLPDYRPFYKELRLWPLVERRRKLLFCLRRLPLLSVPGETPLYSDSGFMLLTLAIERVAGCRLDRYVQTQIYEKQGFRDLFFIDTRQPPPDRAYAATEDCPWRRRLMEGAVHDENAYVLGGVCGHAGLFGTVQAVDALLQGLLQCLSGEKHWFPPSILAHFLSPYAHSGRALGFDMPSARGSSAGQRMDRSSTFGHLGFTGTSFWMETARAISIVLLTNRVHPDRRNERIKAFRPALHDCVMSGF